MADKTTDGGAGEQASKHMVLPMISVIVPAYNAEGTLPRLLRSILEQTFSDFEVIVVDDGSSDATEEAFYKVAGSDSRFRLISLGQNQGVSNARNVGIDHAQGDFLYFCDADDRVLPKAFEELVAAGSDADVALLASRFYTDEITWDYFAPWTGSDLELIEQSGPIASGCEGYIWSYFFKADVIGRERFNTDFSLLEDAEFISRVCLGGLRYRLLDQPLYCYNARSVGSALNTMTVEKDIVHKRMRCLLEERTRCIERSDLLMSHYSRSCFKVLRRVATDKKRYFEESRLEEDSIAGLRELGDWRSRLLIFAARQPRPARWVFVAVSFVYKIKR